jgi:hypothetical protein
MLPQRSPASTPRVEDSAPQLSLDSCSASLEPWQNLLVRASGTVFVSATSFFEFADPQLDSAGDFPRALTAGLFLPLRFQLIRLLISVFDDSDLGLHDLLPAWL